ncbi:MAG: chemotaxis protein CheB [Solirubrobacterales bacterium]|nr:chemotaxis protein CheB [Solirubrobacterales bacterium]
MASPESPTSSPAARDLVVMGASAGGVETLRRVVERLPLDLPAAVCIVLHIAPDSPSLLARILARAGPLPCRAAHEAEALVPGEILVAPPDRHLVVENEHVHLSVGPRENGHRPAVDVLFRSAAEAKGSRVIGVVLSGTRGDGAIGLAAVKANGGATIVQDPDEALYAGMPTTALAHVAVDAVVPSELVAQTIVAMVKGDDTPPGTQSNQYPPTTGEPAQDETTICPECGGVLTERDEAGTTLWQCRVGHRYSPESLLDAQAMDVEAAMWAAVRALEDRGRLLERMADDFEPRGQIRSAQSFREKARDTREQARTVREALMRAAQVGLSRVDVVDTEADDEEVRGAAGGGPP